MYKTKAEKRGKGPDAGFVDEIAINPAHELGLCEHFPGFDSAEY